MRIIRTVVEEISVSEKVDAESAIYDRLYEAFDALKWWLARKAESGEIIDDYHWLYKQKGNEPENIPALVVIYTFTENEVNILHLLIRLPPL